MYFMKLHIIRCTACFRCIFTVHKLFKIYHIPEPQETILEFSTLLAICMHMHIIYFINKYLAILQITKKPFLRIFI